MTKRLVVVAGPANTAKMAKAWEIAAQDPNLRLVHRDQVRVLFGRSVSESCLTTIIGTMVWSLLRDGYSVVTVAQNQEASDEAMWERLAIKRDAVLEWVEMDKVYQS